MEDAPVNLKLTHKQAEWLRTHCATQQGVESRRRDRSRASSGTTRGPSGDFKFHDDKMLMFRDLKMALAAALGDTKYGKRCR